MKKFCKNCGKELTITQRHNIFCSNQCYSDFQYTQYIERWLRNEENGLRGEGQLSLYVRRYLLDKANYCCEKCGWNKTNPVTQKSPLEIHHIDGDWSNNCLENLQVLCPNCHSLTETYKNLNNNDVKRNRKQYHNRKPIEKIIDIKQYEPNN